MTVWVKKGTWVLAEPDANESDIDLAMPFGQSPFEPRPGARKGKTRLDLVPQQPNEDSTVRAIARILLASSRQRQVGSDYKAEVTGLYRLLKPYGISQQAVQLAVGLARTERGNRLGTAHAPNARLAEHGASLTEQVRKVRDNEVYFRAAYLANAAHRMQATLDSGGTQADALRGEAQYFKAHERARKGRLNSVAQVQRAANMFGQPEQNGTLVGWYINPLLNNETECLTANGHNFYAEEGTVIGLPGSVHAGCGCYAGAPHYGATSVNEAFTNVIPFRRSRPKFKLKERRKA